MIGSATAASILQPQKSLLQGEKSSANPNDLTEAEKKQVEELKQRDREVRQHEQAHKTVGGPYAGAVQYETQTGPDGREYAIGGEVPIDASPVPNNPEATIRKMDVVIRAALAPAEPSPKDRAVAAQAQAQRAEAQSQLNAENKQDDGEKDTKSFIETLIEEQTKADYQRASSAYDTTPSAQVAQAAASILSAIAV
jgi:hypothetical protein